MNTPADVPQYVNDIDAPELYADGVSGTFWHNGVIRMTLESLRVDHS